MVDKRLLGFFSVFIAVNSYFFETLPLDLALYSTFFAFIASLSLYFILLTNLIVKDVRIRIQVISGILIVIFSIYTIFAPSYYSARASYAFSTNSWPINHQCYKKRDINKDLAFNLLQKNYDKVFTIYGPKGIGKSSF